MEVQNICYLQRMPDEILHQIFSYLNPVDILSIASLSKKFENFCYDPGLSRVMDFQLEYSFKTYHINILTNELRASLITSLNINCLFWLNADILRQSLPALKALEELYILDTELGFSVADIRVYNKLTKLKKIALTLKGEQEISSKVRSIFPKVTHFCLHVYSTSRDVYESAVQFIQNLQGLEILILVEPIKTHTDSVILHYEYLPKSLRKFTSHLYNIQLSSGNITSCIKQYCVYRNIQARQYVFEKLGEEEYLKTQQVNLLLNRKYSKIAELLDHLTFSISDSRKIELGLETLDEIYYDELYFANFYYHFFCVKLSIVQMLFSENTKKLKKLAITYYLVAKTTTKQQGDNKEQKIPVNILKKISEHCPNLEVLELWCSESNVAITDDILGGIKHIKNLRKLTMQNFPKTCTGKCLVEICVSCKHLTSLKIHSCTRSNELTDFICSALPHAKSLLHFHFSGFICVDRILESLPKKLQRVFLESRVDILPDERRLRSFLNESEGLKFLCIILSASQGQKVRHFVKELRLAFKKSDKFIVVHSNFKAIRLKIPSVYLHETAELKSQVCTQDLFRFDWE